MEKIVQTTGIGTPEHKYLYFKLNPDTGYFQMIRGVMGFQKVPNELKLEQTQRKEIIKSDFLIRGRIKNGKYLFFTGLLKTNFDNWYFGDFFEIRNGIKKNSLILFNFSQDQTRFEMYFFNHFKLYPKHRGYFIRDFINSIKE
ncbi:hypothetical protein H8E88_10535 [candidate division KSB1 bacterium]|nr:hypothetical protein [candidate division KSB1 bacterium]